MKKIYIKNISDIQVDNSLLNIISYTDKTMNEISLKAWSLLSKILLEDYNIKLSKEILKYNNFNKPYIKDNPIYFNISHSNKYIAIIICDKECGIDIEYVDYMRDIKKLSKKIFTKTESFFSKFFINKHKYFYKQWTKKEAYFKKIGIGIEFNNLNKTIIKKDIKTIKLKNKENNELYYVSYMK